MLDSVPDGSGPLWALLTMWKLTVVLVVIGGLLGAAAAFVRTPHYTAESRLIVGNDDLSSYEVAGFGEASQELASNYARYVDNGSTVTRGLKKSLRARTADLISVSASPIAGSDVISVEVVADSSRTAVAGARSVARTLVALTKGGNSSNAAELLSQYEKISAKVQSARTMVSHLSGQLARAKSRNNPTSGLEAKLNSAQTISASLNLQQSAVGQQYQSAIVNPPSDSRLLIIQAASVIGDDRKKTFEIYVFGGAIGGLFVAFAATNGWQVRRVRRRRRV